MVLSNRKAPDFGNTLNARAIPLYDGFHDLRITPDQSYQMKIALY
jgi:hypothetical protein